MFMTKGELEGMKALNAVMRKWHTTTYPSGMRYTYLEIAHGVRYGYDHLPEGGFKLAQGRKVFADELEAQDAVVRALRKRVKGWLKELDLLLVK